MTQAKYGKLTAGLITAWFIFSLAASGLNLFRTGPSVPGLRVGLAALTPIAVFLIWFAMSNSFRQFALSLNPRALTLAHTWRVAGFVFLVLSTYGILPRLFALPAGWGDITIGATAPFIALKLAHPNHQKAFILWHGLGILDLVMAVSLGATAALLNPQGITTGAMTVLPLSLIPTFVVPLLLILHLICIAQALRWRTDRPTYFTEQLPSSAA